MRQNIFQKIALLIYILIILLICLYFVPFSGTEMGYTYNPWDDDFSYQNKGVNTYHSDILNEGFGSMSYFRFLIYLLIPITVMYFVNKFLKEMNSLSVELYKKKARQELYVFILFVAIIGGTLLFLHGKNQYLEKIFYNDEEIKNNIIFAFLSSFISLYMIRPLFSMFKGMFKEVS